MAAHAPQFSLLQLKGPASRLAPYAVVLSSDLIENLSVILVAPVRALAAHGPLTRRLHVPVEFDGERWVVVSEELVSLPINVLGKRVGTLESHRAALVSALDFLFHGY